jgi:hypothetical protein
MTIPDHNKTNHTPWSQLYTVVLLLLVFLASRLHNLDAMPLFIDESLYIDTAQQAREGHFLGSAVENGRLLHVWYDAFLSPYPPAVGWVARAGMVIAGLLGPAAFYGLARTLISHRAGIIAMILWIASPYLLFYERMTLADTMLNITSIPLVLLAWYLVQHPSQRAALGLGLMLVVVLLAKVTGLVWLPLPLVAVLLAQNLSWRDRVRLAAISYGAFGVLWLPFLAVLRWKNYDYLSLRSHFVGEVDSGLLERTWDNIQLAWNVDVTYLSLPLVVIAILGGIVWLTVRPRSGLFALLVLGMIGGGSLMFGTFVNSRRILSHLPWVLLPAVVGAELLLRRKPRWTPVAYLGLGVWLLMVYYPFQRDAWQAPQDLPLYVNDRGEYITDDSSGYGVTEIGHRLSTVAPPPTVVGLIANCLTLRYTAYPAHVICPTIHWDGTGQDALMQLVEQHATASPVFVVGEDLPYVDLSKLPRPNSSIARVERPGGGQPVTLCLVGQGALRPAPD